LCKKYRQGDKITVKGRLEMTFAIGGETTGWKVTLESSNEIEINGKKYKSIEVDPMDKKIDHLEHKTVEITGTLQKREGIERGEYWVIVVHSINEANS